MDLVLPSSLKLKIRMLHFLNSYIHDFEMSNTSEVRNNRGSVDSLCRDDMDVA